MEKDSNSHAVFLLLYPRARSPVLPPSPYPLFATPVGATRSRARAAVWAALSVLFARGNLRRPGLEGAHGERDRDGVPGRF